MKTKILAILMVLVISVMAIPMSVFADSYTGDGSGGINGDGGASAVTRLILDNKNTTTWQRITDTKYGVFTYNISGATFNWSLALQGADAGVDYCLIYFANPYPGTGKLLWSGSAGSDGRIDVTSASGVQPICNLPFASDPNRVAVPGVDRKLVPDFYPVNMTEGAKIWLVPASCYDGTNQRLNTWNDTVTAQMFFETGLINYAYTGGTSDGVSVGLTTTIIEPTVGISVTPTAINFGSVMIGQSSALFPITITNIGNIPAHLSTSVSAGFYTDCLWLQSPSAGWILAKNWIYEGNTLAVNPATGYSIVVQAKVIPTAAYATASIVGTIAFFAAP